MVTSTVVFVDLSGSTAAFELVGNSAATQAILNVTQWIGHMCHEHQGRVIKNLGDGVLALFPNSLAALRTVVQIQREHSSRIRSWPPALQMKLKAGVATGEVIQVDGDCYGDPVNVASRLSDLSGSDQIWVNDTAIDELPGHTGLRYRSLGAVPIRGKAEACVVYQMDWQEEVATDYLTIPAVFSAPGGSTAPGTRRIRLSWLDQSGHFSVDNLPIHIGRVPQADFVVNDPRVSRIHVRIEWRDNTFVAIDKSSYGTWLRFANTDTELALRRGECALHGSGDLALGGPFNDFSVPNVSFEV